MLWKKTSLFHVDFEPFGSHTPSPLFLSYLPQPGFSLLPIFQVRLGWGMIILLRYITGSLRPTIFLNGCFNWIWANYSDLSRGRPKRWFSRGNLLFHRFVKYYDLARLDDEPNLYMENGWKSPFPSTSKLVVWEFQVGDMVFFREMLNHFPKNTLANF